MEIEKIKITNTELNTQFYLYVVSSNLSSFEKFLLGDRHPEYKCSPMPGVSWDAIKGLDCIFDRRPKKFPVDDILNWLVSLFPDVNTSVTKDEVIYALERFSKKAEEVKNDEPEDA